MSDQQDTLAVSGPVQGVSSIAGCRLPPRKYLLFLCFRSYLSTLQSSDESVLLLECFNFKFSHALVWYGHWWNVDKTDLF